MQGSNTTTLVFLGTCLGFAETALGLLAGLTDANSTWVAAFALGALGLVLAALVLMYWRDPAFLTLSGEQALDLRTIEAVLENVPPELIPAYLRSLSYLTHQEIQLGESEEVGRLEEATAEEAEEIERAYLEM